MTPPSRRIRARCPASGEPTWIIWLPSVMIPAELTSRSTSTHLVAARAPGNGPDGGGPAGRAPARRSLARSTSVSREGTVLIRHPPVLRCTVAVSIQKVTVCPARAVALPSSNSSLRGPHRGCAPRSWQISASIPASSWRG